VAILKSIRAWIGSQMLDTKQVINADEKVVLLLLSCETLFIWL